PASAPGDVNPAAQAQLPASASFTGPRAPEILFHGIGLAFDERLPVLRDLQLRIPAGQTTAIVGASGCGKSSLVRLLLRLQEPQCGTILVGGTAITEMPIHSLRAMAAVVPQDVLLLHASVAANIAFGKEDATQPEIERAAQLAGLHELIACLPTGYATIIGERGLKLSGGERQRIAIARAVLRDPLIYILDEATSMLDAATEASLMQRFRDIATGRTTLVIAHRLSTVRHAHQIAVLEDGRVVEIGAHAALIKLGGRYAALWRAQEAARLTARPV
ncbi:MAG: ATP-binding cassette domain-containing protein, partial [Rubrivivax sp.]